MNEKEVLRLILKQIDIRSIISLILWGIACCFIYIETGIVTAAAVFGLYLLIIFIFLIFGAIAVTLKKGLK